MKYPIFRQGYENPNQAGIQISDVDDIPMWSVKDLSAASIINFFDSTGVPGPNENTSLQSSGLIDQNKDYDVKRIEFYVMKQTGGGLVAADLDTLGALIRERYVTIYTNESKRSWNAPMSALLRYPLAVAAAGAMAYNPDVILGGYMTINMPDGMGLVIKGGTTFTLQFSTTAASPTNLSTLRLAIVLRGRRYALQKVPVQ